MKPTRQQIIDFVRATLVLPQISSTVCPVCGDSKTIIGAYGESIEPCPYCVTGEIQVVDLTR